MPESQAERIIFYIHGGGYISGSPVTHRGVITQLARQAGARVLALDYRLAPEYPYPAAVEDVWTRIGGYYPKVLPRRILRSPAILPAAV